MKYLIKLTAMFAIPDNQKNCIAKFVRNFGGSFCAGANDDATVRHNKRCVNMVRVFMDYQELIIKILQTLIIEKEQIFKENKF